MWHRAGLAMGLVPASPAARGDGHLCEARVCAEPDGHQL